MSAALHVLAVKGAARLPLLAAADGRAESELAVELERLKEAGHAAHLPRREMWRITPDGRAAHTAWLETEVPAEARQRLEPGHGRFLPLNHRFKEMCTRWQLRGGEPNDHTDAGYDAALVAELSGLHEESTRLLAELAAVRPGFARYAERLAAALDRLRGGETNAFTGVMCESYHDVWMDLHRDLLLTLRIEREAEEAAGEAAGAAR
jgi:hypothetical protein